MLNFGGHAAQNERELRGFRFLWNGIQQPISSLITFADLTWQHPYSAIGVRLRGGQPGAAIRTGLKGYLPVPCDCYISGITMLADVVGTVVVDIYKTDLAHLPPGPNNSIIDLAAERPTMTNAQSMQDWALEKWERELKQGALLAFNFLTLQGGITSLTLTLFTTRHDKP